MANQEELAGKWIVRNARESSNLAELLICQRAARLSVSQAEGLALLGQRAAVLLPPEDLPHETPPSAPPCLVYHRVRKTDDKIDYALPFELQASDGQEAIYHCLLAHDIAASLNCAALCTIDEKLAGTLQSTQLPSHEMIEAITPISHTQTPPPADKKIIAEVQRSFSGFQRRFGINIDIIQSFHWQAEGICLVSAGSDVEFALRMSELIQQSGQSCAVLKIALIAPFPHHDVATMLARQKHVLVIGDSSTPEHSDIWNGVRQALYDLDKKPALAYVFNRDEDIYKNIAQILALPPTLLLSQHARNTIPNNATLNIGAAPSGALARGLLLDVANYLCKIHKLRAFDLHSPQKLISIIQMAPSPEPQKDTQLDFLFLSHPGLIDIPDILTNLKDNAAVLIQGRSLSEQSFWPLFSTQQQDFIRSHNIRLFALPNDIVGEYQNIEMLGSFSVHGAILRCMQNPQNTDFLQKLTQSQILFPNELQQLQNGWNNTNDVDRSVVTKIETDPYFMPQRNLPRALPGPGKKQESLDWKQAIRQFYLTGQSSYSKNHPLPALSIRPAALNPLLQQIQAQPQYPLLLSIIKGKIHTQSLHEVLMQHLHDETLCHSLVDCAQQDLAKQAKPQDAAQYLQNLLQNDIANTEQPINQIIGKLPQDTVLIGLNENTLLNFYITAVKAARRERMTDVIAEVKSLLIQLQEALRIDDDYGPSGRSSSALLGAFGDAGIAFLNTEELAGKLSSQARGHKMHEPQRVARMRQCLKILEQFLSQIDESLDLILVHSGLIPDAQSYPQVRIIKHLDTIELATGIFDAIAENHVEAFKAMRVARLDIEANYDADLHANILNHFSWQDLSHTELRLLPVVCICETSSSLYSMLTQLSQLIRSGRPIDVLAMDSTSELMLNTDPLQRSHPYNPGFSYLATAYREAFVAQSSLARPKQLLQTFYKMNELSRPAVAVVSTPTWSWRLPPLVQLEAAHYGRVAPLFQYDPSIGQTRIERFSIDDNPQPEAVWPRVTISTTNETAHTCSMEVAFTFAHALALEPGYLQYFRVLPNEAWNDELIEVWDFLQNPRFDSPQIPFIWGVIDGLLRKCVMTREVANTCIDRMQRWTTLQELSFSNKTQLQRSAAALAEKTKQNQEQELALLNTQHQTQLREIKSRAIDDTLASIADFISQLRHQNIEPQTEGELNKAEELLETVSPQAIETPQPSPLVEHETKTPRTQAHIDAVRCLSCGACLAINDALFAFNEEMKAEIIDRTAGSFAQILQAAELCPAECIAPGLPLDSESASAHEIERAQVYNNK